MHRIDQIIRLLVVDAVRETWGDPPREEQVQIQKTRREFEGDFTVVVFPLLRYSKLSPEETGKVPWESTCCETFRHAVGIQCDQRLPEPCGGTAILEGFLGERSAVRYLWDPEAWPGMLPGS